MTKSSCRVDNLCWLRIWLWNRKVSWKGLDKGGAGYICKVLNDVTTQQNMHHVVWDFYALTSNISVM